MLSPCTPDRPTHLHNTFIQFDNILNSKYELIMTLKVAQLPQKHGKNNRFDIDIKQDDVELQKETTMSPPCQFYLLPLRNVNWLTEIEIKSYISFLIFIWF